MRLRYLSEQFAVRAEPCQLQDVLAGFLVDQQQIRLQVALSVSGPVALKYTPRNETLAEQFQIAREEERQLGTIISEAEAAERDRKRHEDKRREAGAVDRADYLETAEMKRAQALLLRAKGMKQREIAAEMGVSVMAVNSYLKSNS